MQKDNYITDGSFKDVGENLAKEEGGNSINPIS